MYSIQSDRLRMFFVACIYFAVGMSVLVFYSYIGARKDHPPYRYIWTIAVFALMWDLYSFSCLITGKSGVLVVPIVFYSIAISFNPTPLFFADQGGLMGNVYVKSSEAAVFMGVHMLNFAIPSIVEIWRRGPGKARCKR